MDYDDSLARVPTAVSNTNKSNRTWTKINMLIKVCVGVLSMPTATDDDADRLRMSILCFISLYVRPTVRAVVSFDSQAIQ